jgi:hypothetical protein
MSKNATGFLQHFVQTALTKMHHGDILVIVKIYVCAKDRSSMMKKLVFFIALAFLAVCLAGGSVALAEEEETVEVYDYVYVTIADDNGRTVLAYEEIILEDKDGDGILTMHDALTCAHEQKYKDGADGYAAEVTEYGYSMTKLWGCANGVSYGYYLNNASPQSLADTVENGDHIVAFVYTDLVGYTDTYCYFDPHHVAVTGDKPLTLTLYTLGYDQDWNTVSTPLAGAVISIDGKTTSYVTDEDGKVTITFDGAGICTLTARKEGMILVPPVCTVAVNGEAADAGDRNAILLWVAFGTVAFLPLIPLWRKIRRAKL